MQSAFDIYAGVPGGNTQLLASVSDFVGAQNHMKRLATQTPGPYFILNTWSFCVLAQVNTLPKSPVGPKSAVGPKREYSMAI